MKLYYENKVLEDLPEEIWVEAYGLEHYMVSSLGRVKSLARVVLRSDGRERKFPEKIMSQAKIKHRGSSQFSLYCRLTVETGIYKNFTIASLVLNSFRTPDKYNDSTHHINGISHDNRLVNLCFEDLSTKRKIEYDANLRDGAKTTAHFINSESHKATMKRFKDEKFWLKPKNKPESFEKRNKVPVTVYIAETGFIGSFTCIKNASEQLGIKEYTLRNARDKPKKYKKIQVKNSTLTLKQFNPR